MIRMIRMIINFRVGRLFVIFVLKIVEHPHSIQWVSTGWSSFTGWDGMRWPYLRDFPPFTHLAGHHWWGINRPDQPCSCWLCSKSSMTFGGWGRLTSYALMVRDTIYNVVHFWGKSHRSTRSRNAAKLLESQWSKNRNGWSCEISPKAPCLLWHLTSDSSFLAQKISAIWQLDHIGSTKITLWLRWNTVNPCKSLNLLDHTIILDDDHFPHLANRNLKVHPCSDIAWAMVECASCGHGAWQLRHGCH